MANLFIKLAQLAETCDSLSLQKVADHIDAASRRLMVIKKAQYAGFQSWAVRNSRCWGNCYRQKRASERSKSAQEVWMSCWNEYTNAMKGDAEVWDKYAEGDSSIKTAADAKFAKRFHQLVGTPIVQGKDCGLVIASQIDSDKTAFSDQITTLADNLSSLAEKLNEKHPDLSQKLANVSAEIIKEAGLGTWLGDVTGWNGAHNRKEKQQMDTNLGWFDEIDQRVNVYVARASKRYGKSLRSGSPLMNMIVERILYEVSVLTKQMGRDNPMLPRISAMYNRPNVEQMIKRKVKELATATATTTTPPPIPSTTPPPIPSGAVVPATLNPAQEKELMRWNSLPSVKSLLPGMKLVAVPATTP